MGVLSKLVNWVAPTETISNIETLESQGIIDDECCCKVATLWQYEYALTVVSNLLGAMLADTEWLTYKAGEKIESEDYFRFNFAFNSKETAAETYRKIAKELIFNNEVLLVEMANKELFVASSWSYKNGQEEYIKPNTYTNVMIGTLQLNRSFIEGKSAIHLKMPIADTTKEVFNTMAQTYQDIMNLMKKGADKAMGTKLALALSQQGSNSYDEKYLETLQEVYGKLMQRPNAVFLTYRGETLTDLTEKQRGSEVQQVLSLGENTIKVNQEILISVGRAYGIPSNVITGNYTEDSSDIYSMTITNFCKPIFKMICERFSLFYLEKEDIIKGSKIAADYDSIRFTETLNRASAIDKLIGSGAYTINEVREKLGDDPVNDGDTRFITKNYAVLNDYVKGETE